MASECFEPEEILDSLSSLPRLAESPFYDRAREFVLSDWMLAYALDHELDEEFHFGGLPDLSDFLLRADGNTNIDLRQLAEILNSKNTKFFKYLKKYLKDRILIDLGCGVPDLSVVPRVLAEISEAKGYIGIDLLHASNSIRRNEFSKVSRFWSLFGRADSLQFLKIFNRKSLCFLLSGIELKDFKSDFGNSYCADLISNIVERMDKKSLLILCVSSRDFSPADFGLRLIYSDPHHELFVKKGIFF